MKIIKFILINLASLLLVATQSFAHEEWMVQKLNPDIINTQDGISYYMDINKTDAIYPYSKNYLKIQNKISDTNLKKLYSDLDFRIIEDSKRCPIMTATFLKNFDSKKRCIRIDYESQNFSSYSVLLSPLNSTHTKLVIYNHGHDGLPLLKHQYVDQLFEKLMINGYDILLVSMPFIGSNFINYPIVINTWDGPARFDPTELQWPYVPHMLFTMLNVGSSHYMRFFIDDSISFALSHPEYQSINYIGLSGGATIGTIICSAIAQKMDSCVLQSGVMPLDLRLNKSSIGDLEQIDGSFWAVNSVYSQLSNMENYGVNVALIYNSEDECCFRGSEAEIFKKNLKKRNIDTAVIIREEANHNFDPETVFNLISRKRFVKNFE